MSIGAGLSSAMSGLTAAARAAELVSSNIANAMTEGYGRRELQTSSRLIGSTGSGVLVTGVRRVTDLVLIGDRRLAEAGAGSRDARASYLGRLEAMIGGPDSANSLASRIAAFDSALIDASSRPDSEARLQNVLNSARGLADHLAAAATDTQSARAVADARIGSEVERVNTALVRVAEINEQILRNSGSGRDVSGLMDQRQQIVDDIAGIIPLREVARDNGQISLYTLGGAVLLEGRPQQLGFTPAGVIVAGMTQGTGALSGLTLNGRAIATSGEGSPIAGGSLAAQFAIRDDIAPEAQARLDAVSRDLVERFAASGLDSTLAPGAPGLFTDAGGAFVAANEVGLAQRLQLNAAADPDQGGALWRLRDGLGALVQGAPGDASFINRLRTALTAQQPVASGGFMAGTYSFSGLAADLISGIATDRLAAEDEATYAAAKVSTLRGMELEGGVDTDQEMQTLLLIEQSYAANARVIQTIDDMVKTLLSM